MSTVNVLNLVFFLPERVRHIKGLLDLPICMVEDNVERRYLWSPPSGEDYSCYYRPRGSTRYGSNRDKHLPAVGIGKDTVTQSLYTEELK